MVALGCLETGVPGRGLGAWALPLGWGLKGGQDHPALQMRKQRVTGAGPPMGLPGLGIQ